MGIHRGGRMTAIDWNPAWTTGIETIDEQHRVLVGHLQRLLAAADAGRKAAEGEATLLHLAQYVDFHFATEERLMAQTAFAGALEHRAIHDGLRQRMTGILERAMVAEQGATEEVLQFLRDWLVEHLGGVDQVLAAHLREAAAGPEGGASR